MAWWFAVDTFVEVTRPQWCILITVEESGTAATFEPHYKWKEAPQGLWWCCVRVRRHNNNIEIAFSPILIQDVSFGGKLGMDVTDVYPYLLWSKSAITEDDIWSRRFVSFVSVVHVCRCLHREHEDIVDHFSNALTSVWGFGSNFHEQAYVTCIYS